MALPSVSTTRLVVLVSSVSHRYDRKTIKLSSGHSSLRFTTRCLGHSTAIASRTNESSVRAKPESKYSFVAEWLKHNAEPGQNKKSKSGMSRLHFFEYRGIGIVIAAPFNHPRKNVAARQ